MARIKGVDIPNNKRVEISLTYVYGIGRSLSNKILEAANIDKNRKVADLIKDNLVEDSFTLTVETNLAELLQATQLIKLEIVSPF